MNKNPETFEEEFMELCEKKEWEIASFYLNDLYKKGHDDLADRLRAKYLELFEIANDYTFEPYQHPTPPVLEARWFEGTPKEYEESARETAENSEAVYRAHKARVSNEG